MSLTVPHAAAAPAPGSPGLEPLRGLLADVRRRARAWIWLDALAWLAILACVAFWASFAFDWCVEPPPWARGLALAVAGGGLAWVLVERLVLRLAVPLRDEALAVIVERSHPAFRDSLATAIGLAANARADVDPRLLARTTAEAAALVGQVDRRRIFRHRRLSLLAAAAALGMATVALFAGLAPATAGVWARRALLLADEPWPRRTVLEAEGFVAGARKVARGSDVDVVIRGGGIDGPPAAVELRMRGPSGSKAVRMGTRGGRAGGEQTFGHVIESVNAAMVLDVRGGDARLRNLRLVVVDPPGVEEVRILGTPPAYLGGPDRSPPVSRLVGLPRGSRVEIRCLATKPLAAARLAVRPVGTPPAAGETLIGGLSGGPPGLEVAGVVPRLDHDLLVTLDLLDTDGLAGREPTTFTLVAVPDEVPRVAARLPGISTAVTPGARLPVAGTISDDHGLAAGEVRLVARRPSPSRAGAAEEPSAAGVARTVPLAAIRGGEPLVELPAAGEPVPLGPLGLAAGWRLEVTVAARDGCTLDGQPQIGTSDTWTLDVVSPEALQAILEAREIVLRRRYEAAIADLAQGRDRLARDRDSDAPARFGEAVARATGETSEIAAAFRDIRLEFDNNGMSTPEIETRLVVHIADPLAALATVDLPGLAAACRTTQAADVEMLGRRADETLARMRAVLARMLELESFNEVIERLRGVIRAQEEIRAETLRRQKERAREVLE
jgi:hypothetical protein